VKTSEQRKLIERKRRIVYRLRSRSWSAQERPMLSARNIQYDLSDKVRGLACGGLGAMHLLARQLGLIEAIDRELHLLKVHLPYHESDHVLNIAYNLLSGGTCLQDLELRRNDEVYLEALGARRIPDPTTAGDFCRRFREVDVHKLMDTLNETRLKVWQRQPKSFLAQATVDLDGSLAETLGACKQGMGYAYNGTWGYHPLIVSLAETQEPLYLMNRSGERPSHEGAAEYVDKAGALLKRAGFGQITFRGDTDFSQTKQLDRWHAAGYRFIFGIDAHPNLIRMAENLPEAEWTRLERDPKYTVKTAPRQRPENVKERIVREKEFENIRLVSEDVAEFEYQPGACKEMYTVVAVRKNLTIEKGEQALFDDVRYFFYITNIPEHTAAQSVRFANQRCNQENLIAQLKSGVNALAMPLGDLLSNWAYMVMAALAWSLKAWFALLLPEKGRWGQRYRQEKRGALAMEFKTFLNAFMRVPCQLLRPGRRIVFRLLAYNPWQSAFLRAVDVLRC
jgi:hypothetical protein